MSWRSALGRGTTKLVSIVALATAAFVVAAPADAHDRDRRWRHHPPEPRVQYHAPPPVYYYAYAPPRVVYAPPPRVYYPPPAYYGPAYYPYPYRAPPTQFILRFD